MEFAETTGKYEVLKKIGEGTFSNVYKARSLHHDGPPVALKRIYQTSGPTRIYNEIGYLKLFGGSGNIVNLREGLRHEDQVTLVLDYFPHESFADYLPLMTLEDIKKYSHALFSSLAFIHGHHVIHRDIKPSNFLHSRKNGTYLLVDFGLAQPEKDAEKLMLECATKACKGTRSGKRRRRDSDVTGRSPKRSKSNSGTTPRADLGDQRSGGLPKRLKRDPRKHQYAKRAGTRGFRAPEVLMKFTHQTTAIDIWSVGVTLLSLFTGRYPFFHSPDDLTALAEISALVGSEGLRAAALKNNKRVWVHAATPTVNWRNTCERLKTNEELFLPDSAFDLLNLCLALHPTERITAKDALKHAFFDDLEKS